MQLGLNKIKNNIKKMVAKIDTENSRIIFSVKGFITVISFIFSVIFSFYLLVIVPKFNLQDEKIEKMINSQNKVNSELSNSINNLNISIAVLNESLNNLKENQKKSN